MSSTTKLDAVLQLAKNRNFRIFPLHNPRGSSSEWGCSCGNPTCEHIGKHPRIKNHLNKATNDPVQLTKWWTEWPDANIGIVTGKKSGIFALDVDGDIGAASLKSLEESNSPLPETLIAITGKGRHLYFGYPETRIKTSNGKLAPGLDVKGENGSCNVPPSTHGNGQPYRWENADTPIAAAPNWLISRLTEEDVPTPASDSNVIPMGQRNDVMYAEVCELFKTGASKESVLRSALEINRRKCASPLPEAEIRGIVASVAKSHRPNDGAKSPKHVRNPFHWFAYDTVEHLADQHALTDYQQGWRMNLLVYAWQGKGFLVNDPDVLFKLSNASDRKKFKREMHKALHGFERVEKDDLPYLINQQMADQFADKLEALNQKKEAGRQSSLARAQEAALVEKKKREAIPNEKKTEVAA